MPRLATSFQPFHLHTCNQISDHIQTIQFKLLLTGYMHCTVPCQECMHVCMATSVLMGWLAAQVSFVSYAKTLDSCEGVAIYMYIHRSSKVALFLYSQKFPFHLNQTFPLMCFAVSFVAVTSDPSSTASGTLASSSSPPPQERVLGERMCAQAVNHTSSISYLWHNLYLNERWPNLAS